MTTDEKLDALKMGVLVIVPPVVSGTVRLAPQPENMVECRLGIIISDAMFVPFGGTYFNVAFDNKAELIYASSLLAV